MILQGLSEERLLEINQLRESKMSPNSNSNSTINNNNKEEEINLTISSISSKKEKAKKKKVNNYNNKFFSILFCSLHIQIIIIPIII